MTGGRDPITGRFLIGNTAGLGPPESAYHEEQVVVILQRLSDGETLRSICQTDGMPAESTVRKWVMQDTHGLRDRYNQAREIGYMCMADDLLEIADDSASDWIEVDGEKKANKEVVQRSRLRVDTRKWILAKALPKIYGDRVVQAHQMLDEQGNPTAPRVQVSVDLVGDAAPPRRTDVEKRDDGPRIKPDVKFVG